MNDKVVLKKNITLNFPEKADMTGNRINFNQYPTAISIFINVLLAVRCGMDQHRLLDVIHGRKYCKAAGS